MHILHYPKSADRPATIRQWLIEKGGSISPSQPVVLLESSDALIELSSSKAGTLDQKTADERTTVQPGDELARIQETQSEPAPKAEKIETEKQAMPDSTTAPDNVTPLLLPQAGNSMEEGTIVKWLVAEGDTIEKGQIIYELETDKATIEVEADQEGRLAKIVAHEDDTVEVQAPVAYLAENDADVQAYLTAHGETPDQGDQVGITPKEAATSEAPAAEEPEAPQDVTPLLMPQAGNSMEEGTIVSWKVSEGDTIGEGQIIYEVETDKATVEIEADQSGRLARIVAHEDDTVPVQEPVAYLADDDAKVDAYIQAMQAAQTAEAPAAAATETPKAQPRTESAPAVVSAAGRVKASPAARKQAAERGIDLQSIPSGSGPGGRILSTDLDAALPATTEVTRKKLTGMRKAIAKNLTASKQNIPHFYMKQTIDATPLMAFYRAKKAEHPCSLNDALLHCLARALQEFPEFRTRLEGEELVTYPTANIGIAVGMEDGLVVPVAMNADRMSFDAFADETRRLIESARGGKIENMGQGVMTVSNLGMFGIEDFSAIINPPEASILAVSAIREEVIVENGAMRPGRVMSMTLSCDHRVIDGLVAARFMSRLKELLEALGEE